ncbi:MAG: hypothetical protein QME60_02830 [Verrucomicrobiota bacterium]|nr:hypothetical protein [Verrucomicrobiota bacterium]
MKMATWMALMTAALALGAFCGCEIGDDDDSPAPTPATNAPAAAKTFVNATITLGAASEYDSGVLTAPGNGAMEADVKVTTAGFNLKARFVKIADASVHDETTGSDFSISAATLTNETWRLMIRNNNAVSVSAEVTAEYNP